jgi:hypothetical protein
MNKNIVKKNRGFVILFSMLISSLILLISAGIFNVVQKEVVLSSSARESQRAFYAADSALECALYADLIGIRLDGPGSTKRTPFPVVPNISGESHFGIPEYTCGGEEISSYYLAQSGGTQLYDVPYVFRYQNSYNDADESCAYVLIEKEIRDSVAQPTGPLFDDPLRTETRITAVGFNVCNGNIPDFDDPTLLERRLSLTYNQ